MSVPPVATERLPRVTTGSPLLAGLAAAALFLLAAVVTIRIGQAHVRAGIHTLAPVNFTQKWSGLAVQRELMRHDDLLAMYGSSELIEAVDNRAAEFFRSYPTGFAVAPVGDRGTPLLSLILGIGSMDGAAAGRRIVVSLSPTWFLEDTPVVDRRAFVAHSPELQMGDLIMRTSLPPDLRTRLAQRMVQAPKAFETYSLLNTVLPCVAEHCVFERALPLLAPLWLLRSLPLRAEDYARVMSQLQGTSQPLQRRPARIDWATLESRNDSAWRRLTIDNPFGVKRGTWVRYGAKLLLRKGTQRDSAFLAAMEHAPRWNDLTLLLATLQALGMRPLVLVMPLKGVFLEFTGVSEAARDRFYQHFDSVTAPFGFPTRHFRAYDHDPYFLMDPGSHLSQKGWIVYDQAIDAFYHDTRR